MYNGLDVLMVLNTLGSSVNELCGIEPLFSLHLLTRQKKEKRLMQDSQREKQFLSCDSEFFAHCGVCAQCA